VIGQARSIGYSVTTDELQNGAWGLAAPIITRGRPAEASVGVVTIGQRDETTVAPPVLATASKIALLL
jgi:DNA-binding IclR family transcriptional regulator